MRTYTCILCPNGCVVDPENFAGAKCPKGEAYVRQELTDPRRTISSLAKVTGGDRPLVGVRLTQPVPKARIMDAVRVLRELTLAAPVAAGAVVVRNLLGLGCDVVTLDSIALSTHTSQE